MKIGVVTVSDRASRGEYEDLSGPAIENWLKSAIVTPYEIDKRVIPDGMESVRDTLIDLVDNVGCDLILTTGGTGPSPRDETPEAMKAVLHKELPGFGEQMRRASLEQTPTAVLSRQTAGSRDKSFILNLPGKPVSIAMTLQAVFPAIPYCLDLIGAGRIETDPTVVKAHRPG
ncbi:molybdopterin adenylyltransferase [Ochrobactrum sp. SD129]|nr:molybdopterin adenylyltransferase [Ochrobactrum sp. SD129]